MQQLDIPFEEVLHPFNQEDFGAFSPTAKVPCLIDGERVIWDSLAIVEYLAENHPSVWPWNKYARAWARSASAEMHSGFHVLRDKCSMSCGQRVRLFDEPDSLKQDIQRLEKLWSEGLNQFGGPFLAGEIFTGVDAFYAPIAFRQQTYGFSLNTTAMDYVERLLQLPAMQAWYTAALAETFRDEPHDQFVRKCGDVIEDLRANR